MARQFVEKSLLHIILQMKSNNLYSQALYYRCIVISFEVFATTSRACITMTLWEENRLKFSANVTEW